MPFCPNFSLQSFFTFALLGSACLPSAVGSPKLEVEVSWVGNTFSGVQSWVPQDVEAMAVTPDGTVFTNVPWDEAGGNVTAFKDGKVLGTAGHLHGWGNEGGTAVAANDKFLFIGCQMANEGGGLNDPETWPPKGKTWFGISRRARTDIKAASPFPNGKGGRGDTLKQSFLMIREVEDKSKAHVRSMAANARHLFALDADRRTIWRIDSESMQMTAWLEWPEASLIAVAINAAGKLCVLSQSSQESGIVFFDPAEESPSVKLVERLSFPANSGIGEGKVELAFAIDSSGIVLTSDPDDGLIRRWKPTTGRTLVEMKPLGNSGGILAAPSGQVGDMRFNQISAMGTDAAGNLFVAHHASTGGGSTVLESYAPDNSLRWRVHGLTFVDNGDFDPRDEAQLFTKEERFKVDHTKVPGRDWTYEAYTVNVKENPEDPRLHIWSAGAWLRRIAGKPVLFVGDMNSERLQVYRFATDDASGIAIPCALFSGRHISEKKSPGWPPHQPATGEWLWRDANGNAKFDEGEFASRGADEPPAQAWCVDAAGNIWRGSEKGGIRCFPILEMEVSGLPKWNWEEPKSFPLPAELRELKRLRYDASIDVMFLGGTTAEEKNQHWKPMGPVICRYDNWSTAPKLKWKISAPYAKGSHGHESCEPMGFDIAGDYIFVPYTGASKDIGFKTGHVEVFKIDDGTSVGWMEPSTEVGEIGLQDIRECLTARKLKDGRYAILLEDDYKAKIVLYRWKP